MTPITRMTVFFQRSIRRIDSLDELLSGSDIVSLHLPATPDTKS